MFMEFCSFSSPAVLPVPVVVVPLGISRDFTISDE